MTALRYRVGTWLRTRSRAAVWLTLMVAAVGTALLATAAAAVRASTAPDRFTAAHGDAPDATVTQDGGRPRTDEVAGLPGASEVWGMSFVYGGIGDLESGQFYDALTFTGSYLASGAELVAGRGPDASRPEEFVATKALVDEGALSIGDTVQLVALTQADAAEFGFDPEHASPVLEGVLVGIIDTPSTFDDPSAIVVFSPALLGDERIGLSGTVMAIAFRDGVSMQEFQGQLATLPQAETLSLVAAELVSAETRTAVNGMVIGLWLLAGIGGAAAIAAIGQTLARNVRLSDDEASSISSLGYSRAQIVGESAARAGVIVVAGMVIAVGGSIGASAVFPLGFVRAFEPDPGVRIETVTLLLGALVLIVGLVGWVALVTRPRRFRDARRRPPMVDAAASRCPSPTMATGVRFAFSSRSGDDSSLAASLLGAVVIVATLAGALTFAVSMRRLVDEPARYGNNFDFVVDNGSDEVSPKLLEVLRTDPDVAAFTLYTASQAGIAGTSIAIAGMDQIRGDLAPPLVSGRLPTAANEAAIGRRSARELDVSIGDEITLGNDDHEAQYAVTGVVVPTGLRGNDIVGQGALLTQAGFARLEPSTPPNAAAIDLRSGAPAGTAERIATAGEVPFDDGPVTQPPAILNVARITFVPFALATLLCALAALVSVNVLFTGVRRRNGQVAILRALGADRRWLLRTVWWQAVTSTIVTALIGVPIGLVAGRLLFRSFADHVGAVDDPAIPLAFGFAALVGLVLLGLIAATVAGRPARRDAPASMLRGG